MDLMLANLPISCEAYRIPDRDRMEFWMPNRTPRLTFEIYKPKPE